MSKHTYVLRVALAALWLAVGLAPAAAAEPTQDIYADGVQVGEPAPDFSLPAYPEGEFGLADAAGKNLVLYFYPKDDSPGCTKEACAFRDIAAEFAKLDTLIYGVSSDSLDSHAAFAAKHALNFPLLSDEGGKLRALFGNPAGEQTPLEKRVTYVIDAAGVVRDIIAGPDAANWETHIEGAKAAVARLAGATEESGAEAG